jgi:putative salt-induced outer membrane protein YdiY
VGSEVRDFPRAQLLLVLEGGQKEWDYWSAKATLGFVGRSGNTNQNDVNTTIRVRRQTPKTRLDVNYNANRGEVEGTETINNHNFTATIDALLTAGFFITPAAANLFKDTFQNIDYRITLAAGLGYDIYRGGDFEWSVGLAGGYLTIKNVSVEAGQDDSQNSFTVIPNTKVGWDITDDIELVFDYNAQVALPETSNAFHHAFGEISVDIWDDILDLNFNLTWDRNESPTPDADGNTPERDDFRTAFGIGVSF